MKSSINVATAGRLSPEILALPPASIALADNVMAGPFQFAMASFRFTGRVALMAGA
jgi:hypothetical protein